MQPPAIVRMAWPSPEATTVMENLEQKHVLIVDDDLPSRRLVERLLRCELPGVRMSGAGNGADALSVLAREQVDLMITDLAMPVLDGFELLMEIARRRIRVPLLVISGRESATAHTRALSGGAIEFFEKPIQAGAFLERVHKLLSDGPRSSLLEVVSLSGLARIIGMERRSCALRVTTAGAQGLLIFVAGTLVDARQGVLTGMLAALEMFGWADPSVTVDFTARVSARTIHQSLAEVLRTVERAARSVGPEPPGDAPDRPPEYCSTAPAPRLEHLEPLDADAGEDPPEPSPAAPARANDGARPQPAARVDAVDRTLAEVMRIDGAIGAAVVDWRADECLAVAEGDDRLDVRLAARCDCGVISATMATIDTLGLAGPPQDIVSTVGDQAHLLRPLGGDRRLFLFLAIDTTTGSLALARHRLSRLAHGSDS
jgi:CheY-like chemotaxis protein